MSKEKTVNKRFLEAKSKECEKSETSLAQARDFDTLGTELEPIAERLLAGFDAPIPRC